MKPPFYHWLSRSRDFTGTQTRAEDGTVSVVQLDRLSQQYLAYLNNVRIREQRKSGDLCLR